MLLRSLPQGGPFKMNSVFHAKRAPPRYSGSLAEDAAAFLGLVLVDLARAKRSFSISSAVRPAADCAARPFPAERPDDNDRRRDHDGEPQDHE
jgi:hypothetical protein